MTHFNNLGRGVTQRPFISIVVFIKKNFSFLFVAPATRFLNEIERAQSMMFIDVPFNGFREVIGSNC